MRTAGVGPRVHAQEVNSVRVQQAADGRVATRSMVRRSESAASGAAARLAIFLPGLYEGGAERVMLKLAGGLASRGHAVDVVVARAEGPYLEEVPASVQLVDLHAPRVALSVPHLVRYLRRARPQALLSVMHGNVPALWAGRLARSGVRVVVGEENTLSRAAQCTPDLRVRLAPHLARRFYPCASAIVAVSHGVADDLARSAGIPRERIQVIYNPAVTPEMRALASARLEHPWFQHGAPPVVLTAGRLAPQKDLPTLIRAFARVRQSRQVRLLILGEGQDRSALEALVKQLGLDGDVSLPGFVLNPYPYMAHAAVYVLSSRWEGLPGTLIEALYCGAPVVATDCPSGPREILADGQFGRLVPVEDVPALAQAIDDALDGRVPRPPQASWRPFELEAVLDQYVAVLLGEVAWTAVNSRRDRN